VRGGLGALAHLAAALAALPPSAAAQSIGRLFTTVEERLRLDEIRDYYVPERLARQLAPEPTRGAEPAPPPLPAATVNGVVKRSSGNDTVWIDGSSILAGQATAEGVQVLTDERGDGVRLKLRDGAATARIKAGQQVDFASGTVVDTYRMPPQGSGERPAPGQPVFEGVPRPAGSSEAPQPKPEAASTRP
jgi:hypothetical protein